MKPFEEEMCRHCTEYEYSDDCKQCELDWYKKENKRLLELLERSYNTDCTATRPADVPLKSAEADFVQS